MHKDAPGFTLIDTLVAVTVIGIGMVGVLSMLILAQKNYELSKSRLTAVMLSQEGVEWIRNKRDTNVANAIAWNNGLAAGTYLVDYDGTLTAVTGADATKTPINIVAAQLKLTGSRFGYTGNPLAPTRWYRIVTIATRDENADAIVDGLTVKSWVQWQAHGAVRDHVTTTFLYNWREL